MTHPPGRDPYEHPRLRPGVPIPPPFLGAILLRGLLFWAGARLLLQAVLQSSRFLALLPIAAGWLVVMVCLMGLVEARRRNELLVLANLGVGAGRVAALAVAPALLAEALLFLLRQP